MAPKAIQIVIRTNFIYNAITVADTEIKSGRQHISDNRAIDHAIVFFGAVAAADDFKGIIKILVRLFVKDINRATHSIPAIECSLWSTQNFNTFHVPEASMCCRWQILRVDPVHIGRYSWVTT